MPNYVGTCHCGAVEFEIESDLADPIHCNCSLCIRRSAVMQYVESERFRLVRGEGALVPYKFGRKSGTHYFCGTCGVLPFLHSRWQGESTYAVNTGCLRGVNPYELSPQLVDGASYS